MRPDDALLLDMLLAARDATEFLKERSLEEFRQDRLLQLATTKAVEIVGEASSRLSEEFRREHPQLPWHKIVGMRHRLVHDYFGIDLDQVWKTVKDDFPDLIVLLDQWVPPEGTS